MAEKGGLDRARAQGMSRPESRHTPSPRKGSHIAVNVIASQAKTRCDNWVLPTTNHERSLTGSQLPLPPSS
jgi:hypothetical protein